MNDQGEAEGAVSTGALTCWLARGAMGVVALVVCTACSSEASDAPCPTDEIRCGGTCVASLYDRKNCGACGNACEKGVGCFGGMCTSPAPMPTPKAGHALVVGPDGRIYAIGGYKHLDLTHATGLEATVDAYDPRTNVWTSIAPLLVARIDASAVVFGEKIFVVGGSSGGVEGTKDVEILNPETQSWEAGNWLGVERDYSAVVVGPDNRIWAIWGFQLKPTLSIGDADGWTEVDTPESFPPRWGARAAVGSDGMIYVVGGTESQSGAHPWVGSRRVDAFAPANANATWHDAPAMHAAHLACGATVGPDGRIYVMGGADEHEHGVAEVEAFDPAGGQSAGGQWELVFPMPDARAAMGAVTARDGRIYVVGGIQAFDADALDSVLVYEAGEDRWYW